MYTVEDDCGERDRRIESALADLVDGPGQQPIRVLDEEGRLSGEDAGKLAVFGVHRPNRAYNCAQEWSKSSLTLHARFELAGSCDGWMRDGHLGTDWNDERGFSSSRKQSDGCHEDDHLPSKLPETVRSLPRGKGAFGFDGCSRGYSL